MSWKRPSVLVVGWVAAVVLAVSVGVLTVTLLATSMQDRGPIGSVSVEDVTDASVVPGSSPVSPASETVEAASVSATFAEEFGEIAVSCAGARASMTAVRAADGWREVSHETGPDDDVDAVFTDGAQEAEISVFCNRGRPTIDEIEIDTLGSD